MTHTRSDARPTHRNRKARPSLPQSAEERGVAQQARASDAAHGQSELLGCVIDGYDGRAEHAIEQHVLRHLYSRPIMNANL